MFVTFVGESPPPPRSRGENVVASWPGVDDACSLLGVAGRVDATAGIVGAAFVGVVGRSEGTLLFAGEWFDAVEFCRRNGDCRGEFEVCPGASGDGFNGEVAYLRSQLMV